MSDGVVRRVAALVALVIAASATIATQPAAPTQSSGVDIPIDLEAGERVFARRLDVLVDHGGNKSGGVFLSVADEEFNEPKSTNLRISLVPEDAGEELEISESWLGGVYAELDITGLCRAGCERSYVLVARRPNETESMSTTLRAEMRSTYGGEGAAPPTGAIARLTLGLAPVDQPATVVALHSGVLEVGDSRPDASWSGSLVVPRSAFFGHAPLGYPLAGRVRLTGTTTGSSEDASAALQLTAGEGYPALGEALVQFPTELPELDWLSSCLPDADCRVPFEIRLSRSPRAGESVRFEYELEAALWYLDRTEPPPGVQLLIESAE